MPLFRKLLLSLAALGVVGSVLGASQLATIAGFTATTTNPGTKFTAGTLFMANSAGNNALIINASNLAPGTNLKTYTITITNSGSLPAQYTLKEAASGLATLEGILNLSIQQDVATGGAFLYGASGWTAASPTTTVAAFNGVASAGISLPGTLSGSYWAAGEAHTFTFTVQFPFAYSDTNLDSLRSQTANATFTWSATQ